MSANYLSSKSAASFLFQSVIPAFGSSNEVTLKYFLELQYQITAWAFKFIQIRLHLLSYIIEMFIFTW